MAEKLGEMWTDPAADDEQPRERKAGEQEEQCKEDTAAFRAKGKPGASEKEVVVRESPEGGKGRQE